MAVTTTRAVPEEMLRTPQEFVRRVFIECLADDIRRGRVYVIPEHVHARIPYMYIASEERVSSHPSRLVRVVRELASHIQRVAQLSKRNAVTCVSLPYLDAKTDTFRVRFFSKRVEMGARM